MLLGIPTPRGLMILMHMVIQSPIPRYRTSISIGHYSYRYLHVRTVVHTKVCREEIWWICLTIALNKDGGIISMASYIPACQMASLHHCISADICVYLPTQYKHQYR